MSPRWCEIHVLHTTFVDLSSWRCEKCLNRTHNRWVHLLILCIKSTINQIRWDDMNGWSIVTFSPPENFQVIILFIKTLMNYLQSGFRDLKVQSHAKQFRAQFHSIFSTKKKNRINVHNLINGWKESKKKQ